MNLMINIVKYILEARKKKAKNNTEEKHAEGISILDQITSAKDENREQLIDTFVNTFVRPNGPCIYAFMTDKVRDAIKVGYTDQHPEKRIAQWRELYGRNAGEVTTLGYWSSEEFNEAGERVFFWDHAIHKKISDKGYKQLSHDEFMASLTDAGREIVNIHVSREFFDKYKRLATGELNPDDKEELSAVLIEDIIKQMKMNIRKGTQDFKLYSFDVEGKTSNKEADKIFSAPQSYKNTDLQEDAVKAGVKAVKDGKRNLLMAAVMRFGKTHAAYDIVNRCGFERVVVCSAKADVRKAWRDDINHVDFYKKFVFIETNDEYNWNISAYDDEKNRVITRTAVVYSDGKIVINNEQYDSLEDAYKNKTLIFFFSLQDLGGSIDKIKNKHKQIFGREFDMMIVDETHYGSHANTFGEVTKLRRREIGDDDNSDIEEEQKINKDAEAAMQKLNIKYAVILQVSGTPYYILASNEMVDKDAEIISRVSYSDMLAARDKWNHDHMDEDPSTSPYFGIPTLHKIGLRLTKECYRAMQKNNTSTSLRELFRIKGTRFMYEDAVRSLMISVFGDGSSKSLSFLQNKKVDGNKVCKHTLIVLPMKSACDAMHRLLDKIIDTRERHIFQITGNDASLVNITDIKQLNDKLYELDDHGKKSIILTVNRFLTGVSMPCVDSMIYLKDASSPQEYDQNIFRLCTRYVRNVKNADSESRSRKVNMKENVYLIDFNIANMLKMVSNSAQMKARAEGNPTIERIKELMKEDLKTVPIFAESSPTNEILGKMKRLDNKDLMEIYTGYNRNKSIADIVNDEIDNFELLFTSKKYAKFQDLIQNLNIDADKSTLNMEINDEGDTDIEDIGHGGTGKLTGKKHDNLPEYVDKHNDKKLEKLTKQKFKAVTKNLLYCNICLDDPCSDFKSITERVKKDESFKKMLTEFRVSIGDLNKAYEMMGVNFRQAYDSLIYRMVQMAEDTTKSGYEKFSKALQGLGRLGKSEVVTPQEIVEKMINKFDKSDYEKANSILLVNEKQAEFFMGLYNKFGKSVAQKCKIVASSEIGKHLCIKMLKNIGVNNYIDNIIDIDDVDGNGYYDVNDFLSMKNNEILDMNNGKKFDICLMNPPYAGSLHLKFLEKTIEIADKVISVQPCGFLEVPTSNNYKKYENNIINKINDIQIIPMTEARDLFEIDISEDIMIALCDKNNKRKINIIQKEIYSIIEKILPYVKDNLITDLEEIDKIDGHRVKLGQFKSIVYGGRGADTASRRGACKYVDTRGPYLDGYNEGEDPKYKGKYFKDCYAKGGPHNSKQYNGLVRSIKFKNREEALNFQKSCNTNFTKNWNWIIMTKKYAIVPPSFNKVWTDNDYCEYFKLTEEEAKIMKTHIYDYRTKKPFIKYD